MKELATGQTFQMNAPEQCNLVFIVSDEGKIQAKFREWLENDNWLNDWHHVVAEGIIDTSALADNTKVFRLPSTRYTYENGDHVFLGDIVSFRYKNRMHAEQQGIVNWNEDVKNFMVLQMREEHQDQTPIEMCKFIERIGHVIEATNHEEEE